MLGWDNFKTFSDRLKNALANDLPGMDAQFKLVPPGRNRPDLTIVKGQNPRLAGVLALFYPVGDVPTLVLMKRNTYPGVHSGQISLPGGQVEDHDSDLVQTALREAEEEIGVKRDDVDIVGKLTEVYIPPSNFLVQPVVGLLDHRPNFIPHQDEVHSLLEIPFEDFLSHKNLQETMVEARGFKMKVPAFHVHNHIVWGATAMMVSELTHLVRS